MDKDKVVYNVFISIVKITSILPFKKLATMSTSFSIKIGDIKAKNPLDKKNQAQKKPDIAVHIADVAA